jgi:uncharacterized protein (TIGR02001 family)
MKKLLSASIAAATIAGFAAPAAAVEGLSANAGFVSDYYFRGGNLGDAGAYAGVDYENSGFYVGTWAIDDASGPEDGIEYDLYLGYGMESGDFAWSVGATSYQYTATSNQQNELNLGLGFGGFGLDLAFGNDDKIGGGEEDRDYLYAAFNWSGDIFGATLGYADYDESSEKSVAETDYTYLEVSAGGEVATMDVGVTLGRIIDESSNGDDIGSRDYYMFLDVSKSFDL